MVLAFTVETEKKLNVNVIALRIVTHESVAFMRANIIDYGHVINNNSFLDMLTLRCTQLRNLLFYRHLPLVLLYIVSWHYFYFVMQLALYQSESLRKVWL